MFNELGESIRGEQSDMTSKLLFGAVINLPDIVEFGALVEVGDETKKQQ